MSIAGVVVIVGASLNLGGEPGGIEHTPLGDAWRKGEDALVPCWIETQAVFSTQWSGLTVVSPGSRHVQRTQSSFQFVFLNDASVDLNTRLDF